MTPMPPDQSPVSSAPGRLWMPRIAAWLVVLLPAAWGITQTVLKSLALFR